MVPVGTKERVDQTHPGEEGSSDLYLHLEVRAERVRVSSRSWSGYVSQ